MVRQLFLLLAVSSLSNNHGVLGVADEDDCGLTCASEEIVFGYHECVNQRSVPKKVPKCITKLSLAYNPIVLDENSFKGMEHLTRLDLDNCNITELKNNWFAPLVNLRVLTLFGNGLEIISSGAFRGLKSLVRLVLTSNDIKSVPENVFHGLDNLKDLALANNGITVIHPESFSGLKALQVLHLEKNNITKIPSGAFKHLKNLKSLVLHENQITEIKTGAFDGLKSLETLLLDDNKITRLQSGVLQELTKLRHLHLRNNSISTLDNDVYSQTPLLHSLDLSFNHLTTLNFELFENLYDLRGTFTVYGNPFECTCHLFDALMLLHDMYQHLGGRFYIDMGHCDKDVELHAVIFWMGLDEARRKMRCPTPPPIPYTHRAYCIARNVA